MRRRATNDEIRVAQVDGGRHVGFGRRRGFIFVPPDLIVPVGSVLTFSRLHFSSFQFIVDMSQPGAPAAQAASSFDDAMASRLRHLEAMLEQYADAGRPASAVEAAVDDDEASAVPSKVALRRHRNSVAFLRLHAPASRSAAILYEAALHRDISQRELALGRSGSAVRHCAAGLRLSEKVFEWNEVNFAQFCDALERYCARHGQDADSHTLYGFLLMCKSRSPDAMRQAIAGFESLGNEGSLIRAAFHMALGQHLQVIAECSIALRLGDATQDPSTNFAHYARGMALFHIGDKSGGRADLEKFVSLCAGDERSLCDACYHLAQIAVHRSKDEALAWYKKGSNAESTRSPVFAHLPLPDSKSLVASLFGRTQHACAMRGCQGWGRHYCAGCRLVLYCTAECQRADWKAGHKAACVKRDA